MRDPDLFAHPPPLTCQRPGCNETVFTWLDRDYCSEMCRTRRDWPAAPGTVTVLDETTEQAYKVALATISRTVLAEQLRTGTWQAVTFSTEERGDHNDQRFTAPVAGLYAFGFDPAGTAEHAILIPVAEPKRRRFRWPWNRP